MSHFGAKTVAEMASTYGPKAFRSLTSATTPSIPTMQKALSAGLEGGTIEMGSMLIESGIKLANTVQQSVATSASMVRLGVNLGLENAAFARQSLVTQLGTKKEQLVALQSDINQQLNQFNKALDMSQQKLQELLQSNVGKKVRTQAVNAAYETGKFSYETAVGIASNMIDFKTNAGDVATTRDLFQGNYRSATQGILATLIATELQRSGLKKIDFAGKVPIMNVFNNFCKRSSQFSLPEKADYKAIAATALLAASMASLNRKSNNLNAEPITMSFDKTRQDKKNQDMQKEIRVKSQVKEKRQRPKTS